MGTAATELFGHTFTYDSNTNTGTWVDHRGRLKYSGALEAAPSGFPEETREQLRAAAGPGADAGGGGFDEELFGFAKEAFGLQIDMLRQQAAMAAELFPFQRDFFISQTKVANQLAEAQARVLPLQEKAFADLIASLEETPAQQEIRELSESRTLAILKGEAPTISPESRRLVEETFTASEKEGERALRRFAEELAASRGLRLTDTPIGDVALRERRNLAETLAGAKSASLLQVGTTQQSFQQAVSQFQQNLRQQALQNRLGLAAGPFVSGGGGGGVPSLPTVSISETLGAINPFLNRAQQESQFQQQFGFNQQQSLLGIAGATAQRDFLATQAQKQRQMDFVIASIGLMGAAAGGAGAAVSSARLKRNIRPLDPDEYARALETLRATPVVRYRYRWEGDTDRAPHVGPILELSPPEIREDAWHVNLLDYAGLTHAGLKGLDREVARVTHRVARLEHRGLPITRA